MSDTLDIIIEPCASGVLVIRLNRPNALNALRTNLLRELNDAFHHAEQNSAVRCVVLYGSENVFAAGADIKEMAALDTVGVMHDPRVAYWESIRTFTKPIVAGVNGYALGGGCELALLADILIAGTNAVFGQPEINLGIMPGAGGTQRLIRVVGKSMAMKMVLSGETIDAKTAERFGLVSDICQPELTLETAIKLARKIAQKSPIALRLAKRCLLDSYETSLSNGLREERQAFTLLAATADRQEGIAAFVEKRKAEFKGL